MALTESIDSASRCRPPSSETTSCASFVCITITSIDWCTSHRVWQQRHSCNASGHGCFNSDDGLDHPACRHGMQERCSSGAHRVFLNTSKRKTRRQVPAQLGPADLMNRCGFVFPLLYHNVCIIGDSHHHVCMSCPGFPIVCALPDETDVQTMLGPDGKHPSYAPPAIAATSRGLEIQQATRSGGRA